MSVRIAFLTFSFQNHTDPIRSPSPYFLHRSLLNQLKHPYLQAAFAFLCAEKREKHFKAVLACDLEMRDKILYGTSQPSTVRKRAIYLGQQLALPPEKRLLRVPEADAEQRMYKP